MENLPFRLDRDKRRWSNLSIMQSVVKRKTTLFLLPQRFESFHPNKKAFFPSKDVIRAERRYDKFIFNPTSFMRVIWDALISVQAVYLAVIIPFCLSFMRQVDRSTIAPLEICFIIDLFLNFNTACYIHGILVADRKAIIWHYLSSYFLWDFISVIPYELFLYDMNSDSDKGYNLDYWNWPRLFWLLRLTRMIRLRKLIYNIDDIYPAPYVYFATRSIVFLLIALLAAHWTTCIMHSAWYFSLSNNGDLWQSYMESKFEQYIRKLEQVAVTMTTVGYGNLIPQSTAEKMLTIIIECLTSGLFGYLVGGINSALEKSTKESIYFNTLKQKIKVFMHNHRISYSLRLKIMAYLAHLYSYQKQNILDEQEILSALSQPLQRDIYIHTRGHVLVRSAPFRDFSYKFLKYLGQKLEVEIFSPCDLIFKQDQKNHNLYLVRHGRVEIFHHSTGTIYTEIHEDKYFGEIAFFLGRKRCASARCANFCEVFCLNRQIFKSVLMKLPKEAELTKIIVNNCQGKDLSYLGVRCYFCQEMGHVAADCSAFVYKINHEEIIKRANHAKNAVGKKIAHEDIDVEVKKHDINIMSRYGLNSIYGKKIDPLSQYKDRDTLACKARGFVARKRHGERKRKTILALLDDDTNDIPNQDYYPKMPSNLQFGRNYMSQKRKTQLCPLRGSIYQSSRFNSEAEDVISRAASDANETLNLTYFEASPV
ncbi:unnamed protein product [Blepharisma stoltei]|uniref:Cyclic nucleotide-binding domain-containing protein n=1 Tax=Blepharisma stoltei TaxID=1481888 RepID=A0AAU9IM61_9CILI|nr:unnamed protein product [Blepharisma stoltei]